MNDDPEFARLIERSARLYGRCMQEVKFRLNHTQRILRKLPENNSPENRVLVAEVAALQFRTSIELIALASIAANKKYYARIREDFHRDWNARLIFRELSRLNERFYPRPIAGLSDPKYEGGPSVIEEYDSGFLTLEAAISLYERCSAVIHADNPFGGKTDYHEVLSNFEAQIPLFKLLLGNFWVHLIPADKALCIWMYFDNEKDVDVALFQFG